MITTGSFSPGQDTVPCLIVAICSHVAHPGGCKAAKAYPGLMWEVLPLLTTQYDIIQQHNFRLLMSAPKHPLELDTRHSTIMNIGAQRTATTIGCLETSASTLTLVHAPSKARTTNHYTVVQPLALVLTRLASMLVERGSPPLTLCAAVACHFAPLAETTTTCISIYLG